MQIIQMFCAAAILVLGALDIASTNHILSKGGVELNPVVATIMLHLGVWWWVPKMIVHTIAAVLTAFSESSVVTTLAFAVVLFYLFVVTSNFIQIYIW